MDFDDYIYPLVVVVGLVVIAIRQTNRRSSFRNTAKTLLQEGHHVWKGVLKNPEYSDSPNQECLVVFKDRKILITTNPQTQISGELVNAIDLNKDKVKTSIVGSMMGQGATLQLKEIDGDLYSIGLLRDLTKGMGYKFIHQGTSKDDLEAFLINQDLMPATDGLEQSTRQKRQRSKSSVRGVVTVIIAILVGIAFSMYSHYQEQKQLDELIESYNLGELQQ